MYLNYINEANWNNSYNTIWTTIRIIFFGLLCCNDNKFSIFPIHRGILVVCLGSMSSNWIPESMFIRHFPFYSFIIIRLYNYYQTAFRIQIIISNPISFCLSQTLSVKLIPVFSLIIRYLTRLSIIPIH